MVILSISELGRYLGASDGPKIGCLLLRQHDPPSCPPPPFAVENSLVWGRRDGQVEFGIRNCCRPPADASHRRLRAAHGLLLQMRPDPPRAAAGGFRFRNLGPGASCVDYPPTHPASCFALRRGKSGRRDACPTSWLRNSSSRGIDFLRGSRGGPRLASLTRDDGLLAVFGHPWRN